MQDLVQVTQRARVTENVKYNHNNYFHPFAGIWANFCTVVLVVARVRPLFQVLRAHPEGDQLLKRTRTYSIQILADKLHFHGLIPEAKKDAWVYPVPTGPSPATAEAAVAVSDEVVKKTPK